MFFIVDQNDQIMMILQWVVQFSKEMEIFVKFKEKYVLNRVNGKAYVVKMLVNEGNEKVIEIQCQDCAASEGVDTFM